MTIEELLNILATEKPSIEIKKYETELFTLIPELEACKGFISNIIPGSKDTYENILSIIDNCQNNVITRLSALFIDIGKPIAYKQTTNNKKFWQLSEEIFKSFSEKNNIDIKLKNTVLKVMHYHELNINILNDSIIQKLTTTLSKEELILIFQLQRAIIQTQNYKYNSVIEKHKFQEIRILSKYKEKGE